MEIKNLKVEYDRIVLENVNISLKEGSVYVLSGPSGSGKTSFLNIVGLIQQPNPNCEIIYKGKDLLKLNNNDKSDFIKNNIGYIFQQNNLINNLTVFENVAFQLRTICKNEIEIQKKVIKNLEYLGISHLKDKYPSEISGGEEQRVSIARALSMEQNIILADELTSALDDDNARKIMELLARIAKEKNKIIIISTHNLSLLKYADFHYKIEDNRIVKLKTIESYNNSNFTTNNSEEVQTKQNLFLNPIIKFHKNKKKHSIPRIILLFIGVAISLSIVGMNAISSYTKMQENTYNDLSDKTIFIVNDSLKNKSNQDMEDLMSFSEDVYEQINNIDTIESILPYFEFPAYGLTKENVNEWDPEYFDFRIENKVYTTENLFSLQPLYTSDFQQHHFLEILDNYSSGDLIVHQKFLDENSIPYDVLGKEIKIDIYIPTKQFISYIEKDVGNDFVKYKYDGNIYVKKELSKKIGGILKKTFPYDRSSLGHSFYYDYTLMNKILNENLSSNVSEETFDGFPEKSFGYSAYQISVDKVENLENTIQKINEVSENIEYFSIPQNIKLIEETLNTANRIVYIITLIIFILVVGILFFTFYLTNSFRKKEVGIMKALGLNKKTVIGIYIYELLYYAIIIALTSIISSTIIGGIFVVPLLETAFYSFVLRIAIYSLVFSGIIVIIAGLVPVYSSLKYDPIDIIRLNK